jgi:hypothetical protein
MWKEAPEDLRKKICEDEAQERSLYKIRIADWRQNNEEVRKKQKLEQEDAAETSSEAAVQEDCITAPQHVASAARWGVNEDVDASTPLDQSSETRLRMDTGDTNLRQAAERYDLALNNLVASRQRDEREQTNSLVHETLPQAGRFGRIDNPLAWAMGRQTGLGVPTSLRGNLPAAWLEGGAGMQHQSEGYMQSGIPGIESLIANSSLSATNRMPQYGINWLTNTRPMPRTAIQEHLAQSSSRRGKYKVFRLAELSNIVFWSRSYFSFLSTQSRR